ncbi:hypothetical protein Y032_0062g3318 [Ancylostoma ceylanicum]|uniref:Uncharacterized protein n=1 Tax=Ancylostoma ceylanicum TaxID=53326 RepID=A0A016U1T0_9BILA|nr:hypothetical protein Y032_0062g3318 [Ancylostoma ceylanicum]
MIDVVNTADDFEIKVSEDDTHDNERRSNTHEISSFLAVLRKPNPPNNRCRHGDNQFVPNPQITQAPAGCP